MNFMYTRFCACFISMIIICGSAIAVLNMVVDPYDVWNIYQSVGINQWKFKSEDKERLIKPITVSELQPNVIFLGNSRALDALDAETYQYIFDKTAYNMSVPGITIYEARKYIEHAIAVDSKLEEVILCIDFEMFAENEGTLLKRFEPGFDENQLGHKRMTVNNLAVTLMSWQAFKDSIATILINNNYRIEEPYFVEGRYGETALNYRNHKQDTQFHSQLAYQMRKGNVYTDTWLSDESFNELQCIIDVCRQNNIKITSLILPTHARLMESRTMCWDVFESWRKRIVQMMPVVCFDFYNDKTMTYINGRVEDDTDAYFWEVSHPKKSYGDLILSFLSKGHDELGFGMYVNADNVDECLQLLRRGRAVWENLHPESIEEVKYFSGFYEQTPVMLSGKVILHDGYSLPIDLDESKSKKKYKQSEMLDLSGVRQWRAKNGLAIYGVLMRTDGKTYYALAEPQETPKSKIAVGLMGFLNKHNHDMRGFRLAEPLENVKPGEYDVYILEVDSSGEVYKSDILESVIIE